MTTKSNATKEDNPIIHLRKELSLCLNGCFELASIEFAVDTVNDRPKGWILDCGKEDYELQVADLLMEFAATYTAEVLLENRDAAALSFSLGEVLPKFVKQFIDTWNTEAGIEYPCDEDAEQATA